MKNYHPSKIALLTLLIFILTATAVAHSRPISPGAARAACSVPKQITTPDGREAILEQCYALDFDYQGDTYDVLVYYTESPENQIVVGEEQCTEDEADDGLCEHALPDHDLPGSSDNQWAVQVAEQVPVVLPFYWDRGFPIIGEENFMEIHIAEDSDNGWIEGENILKLDDEYVSSDDPAADKLTMVRANVFHEGQHLIQSKYWASAGIQSWYTEGIARTSQDRTDAAYDAATGGSYMNHFHDVVQDDGGVRSSDLLTIQYRATAFWTWFMDQYRLQSETEPGPGWDAIKDFYLVLDGSGSGLDALEVYLANNQDTTFAEDFIDYTLALYAYIYNPADPRLAFLDAEINNLAAGLSGHAVVSGNQPLAQYLLLMEPRSSRYWEYIPPPTCPFVTFTFQGSGSAGYGFSVLTVNTAGDLQDRWTSRSSQWARTVSSNSLSRVAGVATVLDGDANNLVIVEHGCVTPDLNISSPSAGLPAFVGQAVNPRQFQARLSVTDPDGRGVAGLTKNDFSVELIDPGSDQVLGAGVITAAYVGDDYWLNIQPPYDFEGAQDGKLYHLRVTLANLSDTQQNSVLYVEREVDKLIVLDQSGSMADQGRIAAARNAARLMTFELAPADQGAYIRYANSGALGSPLEPMTGLKPLNMALAIGGTNPGGNTSIGDGLLRAATEEDAHGDDDHFCVMALLSDGYENVAPFWDEVAGDVIDNECFMDVVALGASANEALLQQIAASSAGGGRYDFAQTSGDVPIDPSAAAGRERTAVSGREPTAVTTDLSWQNNLSRIYDAIVTRASGRQRVMSGAGNNAAGPNPTLHTIQVDPTTDELVVSIAWPTPQTPQIIHLVDPAGQTLPTAGHQTIVTGNTAEVWRVVDPKAGKWTVEVSNLFQQYHISASARTLLELQLYAAPPAANAQQGVKVPILATLSGDGDAILDANIAVAVTNPAGKQKFITLYDDGLHGDMEADDGVYGGWYTQTTGGEQSVADPGAVAEGQEPQSRGSYLVQAAAEWSGLRREAQTSFFLREAKDGDGDGFPDWWEEEHGLDPEDPDDAQQDPDGDGLTNRCEWDEGTAPDNPDTDGGGESDGSEMPGCNPGRQDPLDPHDDRIKPIHAVRTSSEATAAGVPYVNLWLEGLQGQNINAVDIYRRAAGDTVAPWVLVGDSVRPPTPANPFSERPPFPGPNPQYRVVPHMTARSTAVDSPTAAQATITGRPLTTAAIPLSRDPYPPQGNVVIAEGETTTSRLVTLLITAVDNPPAGATPRPPGTPTSDLQMRISTAENISGAPWQPFQPRIENFDLGAVLPGQTIDIHSQFRDQAGNISEESEESPATIRYLGPGSNNLFLPIIARS